MRAVTSLSGRLAVAVAAVAALAIGLGTGNLAAPVGVAGALAFGWGAGALGADRNARRALGSVAIAVGGVLALVGMAADGGIAAIAASVLAVLGLAAIAVDATAGLGDETLSPVLSALGSSIATVIGGVAAASVLHVAFGIGVAFVALVALAELSLATALGAFVALQLQALLVGVLMRRSRAVVEEWFPGGVPVDAWEEFEPLSLSLGEVPKAYWAALGVQLLVLLVPGGAALVEWLLASTWLFGDAVGAVLGSGLLHGALALVLLVELLVLGAEVARGGAVSALSPDPPKSLSYAAGGLALVAGVPVVVAAASLVGGLVAGGPAPLLFDGVWATTAAALSLAVVALGVVFAVEVTGVAVAEHSLLPDRAAGFALGATLLFAGAVLAVPAGAPALVTIVGVAAALAAWDLGETAADLGGHLGTAAETRRAEVVHATGTLAVGVGGTVLAALALYLLGPFEVPGTGGRAVAALGLVLVALLSFVVALDRQPAGE